MGGEHFTDVEWAEVTSTDPRQWLRSLQSYTYRWVQKHHRRLRNGPFLPAGDMRFTKSDPTRSGFAF